ncbi:hypothetical protein EV401DRAFT_1984074 [Pisolithus croceorrhizus]|nr:hypothetical protein EV401DRAFT_1984074 [Pisolithus croceorrhizus]
MTNARKNMSTFFLLLPIAAFEEQTNAIGRIPACPPKIYLAAGYKKKAPTAFLPKAYRFLDPLSPGVRTTKLIDGRRSTTALE